MKEGLAARLVHFARGGDWEGDRHMGRFALTLAETSRFR